MSIARLLVVLLLSTPLSVFGGRLVSPDHRVALLELYTSEGCSSCPPADRWLSGLKDDARLWCDIVPVGFHVDYWNYLGWPDRFANPTFSARQRAYARKDHVSNVYTPGFVLSGTEWRGWFARPDDLPLSRQPADVAIEVAFEGSTGRLRINAAEEDYVGHAALLGFDQVTQVKRGENRGRELRHDFVVLELQRLDMQRGSDSLEAAIRFESGLEMSQRYALAVWITQAGSLQPVQSVGGWFDANGSLLPADGC